MRLKPIFSEVLPNFQEIESGQIWISHKHRTINLRCPCGCEDLTVLTIHPSRWHVYFDGKSVSLKGSSGGSVWANSGCGSHYNIIKNKVFWLEAIDSAQHETYAELERSRMVGEEGGKQKKIDWWGRVKCCVIKRLKLLVRSF